MISLGGLSLPWVVFIIDAVHGPIRDALKTFQVDLGVIFDFVLIFSDPVVCFAYSIFLSLVPRLRRNVARRL